MAEYALKQTGAQVQEALNKVATHDTQIGELSEEIANGISTELKTALINYYTHVMPNFDDTNGMTYVNAILTALGADTRGESGGGEEPPTDKTLSSISATYTGGEVAVGTALSDLTGITVTATYSDGSTATVTGYTLSGTIAEGSNTITVSYGGKTTTFTVSGIAESGGEDVEPLYTFEDAEAEVYSLQNVHSGTLTVTNGNHIKLVGDSNDVNSQQKWFFNMNVSSLASNGVTTPTETWFIIPNGATVKLCVKNLIQTNIEQARLGLNTHESIHSAWRFIGDTNGDKSEFTFTANSDKDVKCVYLDVFPAINTLFEIELDVELYVNEVRWI